MRDVVLCGDAREVLSTLDAASIDAVVTDPPYNLQFMGKAWDTGNVAHDADFWREARRVSKPGAFLLAFGGTRTYHRLCCAVEDAGWEIRDSLHWIYASGFPKGKSCLKPAHEPIVLAKAPGLLQPLQIDACRVPTGDDQGRPRGTFPHSDDAWGNGHLERTESHPGGRWPSNLLLSHVPPAPDGTGGCRPVGVRRVRAAGWRDTDKRVCAPGWRLAGDGRDEGAQHYGNDDGYEHVPSWQCVDGCPVKALDGQAGPRTSGGYPPAGGQRSHVATYGRPNGRGEQRFGATTGSVSRFFPTFDGAPEPEDAVPWMYCPKASRRERNAGLDGMKAHPVDRYGACGQGSTPQQTPRVTRMEGNHHPTVKPIALMRWLCRLVTPPGGLVLDPFCGSGSTGVACVREGLHYLLVEQDPGYVDIARQRIAHEHEKQTGPLFAGVAR